MIPPVATTYPLGITVLAALQKEFIVKNRLKAVLAEGRLAIGAQMRFGSPVIAELFGYAGFDFIVIDGEHAAQSPPGVQAQLQGIGCTNATPIVRLVSNDPDQIRLHADLGAMGITIPFINTAEQAAIGARACRYPPAGTRGVGASRGSKFGFDPTYVQQSNDNILYLPIIETAEAVKNIDQILAVDGVDSFLVGPADLSVSLGVAYQFKDPVFLDSLRAVVRAAEDAGKPAGIGMQGDVTRPQTFQSYVDMGFRLLLAGGDEPLLRQNCQNTMAAFTAVRD